MTIELLRKRRNRAVADHDTSAPPGPSRSSGPVSSKWLVFALVALTLSILLPARFLISSASAASSASPSQAVLADDAEGEGATTDDASQPDETDSQDPSVSGRTIAASIPSARGGTRPAPSKGDQLASIAMKYEGAPYRWAGASPAGFDCSGFTMYVYGQAGITIPRDHRGQWNTGRQLEMDELQPGDILFFQNTYSAGLSHSGIFIGDNHFIHAETELTGVVISRLRGSQWESAFVGGSRPYEK